jgi:tetratricopeptide (TPR) repeat protein
VNFQGYLHEKLLRFRAIPLLYYNTSNLFKSGGTLGLLDFFKKKTQEELFQEAIANQDYMEVAKLGEELLRKHPNSLSILNPYVDALVKLGKKEKAVQILINFGEKKIKDEYYDIAIPVLKKALKIDPLNIKAIKLLTTAYRKKELYYDAFKVLTESFKKYKEAGFNTEIIKEILENFLQEQFHPLFYEKYGDLLLEDGEKEKALTNYVLASHMYINLKNYKSALRSLLKAEKIKKSENIDKQIVEVLAHLEPETVTPLLLSLLKEYREDVDFIKFVVEVFKEAGNLLFLKKLAQNLKAPKLKYALLALINFELGETEEAQEYLEKLKIVDRNMYEQVVVSIKVKHEESMPEIQFEPTTAEELPEPEQVLEVLDQVLDLNDIVTEYVDKIETEEKPEEISKEILVLKELDKDGKRFISAAEALLGLEKYDEAEKMAEKALNTDEAFKAISIITEALKKKGQHKEALSFLFNQVKNPNLSEEEIGGIKALIGEIHEELGEKDKALIWYKEANKILKEEELDKKIKELSANG